MRLSMRLKSKTLNFLINFLLGSAWSLALVGAIAAFIRFIDVGFLYALASMVVWSIPGLFLVLVFEYFLAAFERNEELKRQSRLLEDIKKHLESSLDR